MYRPQAAVFPELSFYHADSWCYPWMVIRHSWNHGPSHGFFTMGRVTNACSNPWTNLGSMEQALPSTHGSRATHTRATTQLINLPFTPLRQNEKKRFQNNSPSKKETGKRERRREKRKKRERRTRTDRLRLELFILRSNPGCEHPCSPRPLLSCSYRWYCSCG